MKIIIDMNLSPLWVEFFQGYGIHSTHWSNIGNIKATDEEIFQWSKENNGIILTQDLDFSTILALSNAEKPSVILIRAKNSLPEHIGKLIVDTIQNYTNEIENGSLLVIDESKSRLRILPLN